MAGGKSSPCTGMVRVMVGRSVGYEGIMHHGCRRDTCLGGLGRPGYQECLDCGPKVKSGLAACSLQLCRLQIVDWVPILVARWD